MEKVLENMIRFQTDRQLHLSKFNLEIASKNILEELMEAHGIVDDCYESKEIRKDELYRGLISLINEAKMFTPEKFEEPTEEVIIDSFCDIVEFAIGEPIKLGYDIVECLDEMQKEINSRTGSIINGKFEKDKSIEAQAKWYKADFTKARL